MRLYTLALCVLGVALCSPTWAQAPHDMAASEPARIVLRPTIPAYYPGCTNEPEGSEEKSMCSASRLMSYIASNLRYPDAAREDKIEGVVMLSFVVSDSGVIEQVRVLRDIGGGCGDEAKRIIEEMPTWQAAIFKGKQVYTQFTLPITFGLRTGMFDYVLHLGELDEGEVYRKELVGEVTGSAPRVTDPKGKDLVVAEVIYTFERGGERREFVTRGSELPDEKAFAKFIGKKPGRLTVEANVVEGLDIRPVSKAFLVVR